MKAPPQDKWLLMSCLQKSIRRGHGALAQGYAKSLYEIDANHLLYRLSLIMLEDIGLGNIELVHELMSTQIKKAVIERRGGQDYIVELVAQMSSSIKDRSANDLHILSSFYEPTPQPGRSPRESFLDGSVSLVNRLLLGWELIGAKKLQNPLHELNGKNCNPTSREQLKAVESLCSQLTNDGKIIEIMLNGHLIHREPFFIAIGLLSTILEREKGMPVGNYVAGQYVEQSYALELLNGKWIKQGVDWHTKEGKSAICDFAQKPSAINEHLAGLISEPDNLPSTLAMLLFRQQGHQVNKRLVYPTAVAIMKSMQKVVFTNLTGNDHASFVEAIKIFANDLPVLEAMIEQKLNMPNPEYFPF